MGGRQGVGGTGTTRTVGTRVGATVGGGGGGHDAREVPPRDPRDPLEHEGGVGLKHKEAELRTNVQLVGEGREVLVFVRRLHGQDLHPKDGVSAHTAARRRSRGRGADLHHVRGLLARGRPLCRVEVQRKAPVPDPCGGAGARLQGAQHVCNARNTTRLLRVHGSWRARTHPAALSSPRTWS